MNGIIRIFISMRHTVFVLLALCVITCAKQVPPTVRNVNKIFESQDFTFEYHDRNGTCQSLSFRHDYVVYKSEKPTVRRTISYNEVREINGFIQKIVNDHQETLNPDKTSYYIIQNTAYTTVITPKTAQNNFESLLRSLNL